MVEGQFMAKRLHVEKMGFKMDSSSRILVTGGGSVNTSILQIIADVFNAPVFTQEETKNSAALGAAFRARHVTLGGEKVLTFSQSIKRTDSSQSASCIQPHRDSKSVYRPLLERFKVLEDTITNGEV